MLFGFLSDRFLIADSMSLYETWLLKENKSLRRDAIRDDLAPYLVMLKWNLKSDIMADNLLKSTDKSWSYFYEKGENSKLIAKY